MKSMTQTERSEIHSILKRRYEDKKADLNAKDPGWIQRVEERKRKSAVGRLKVQKEVAELESIESQMRELKLKRDEVHAKITKKMPLEQRAYRNSCPDHKDLCAAIGEICEEIHDQEMAKDATGKKLLKIRAEYVDQQAALAKCSTREDVVSSNLI